MTGIQAERGILGFMGRKEIQDINSCCNDAGCYEIRVKGQLSSNWKDWFEGMEIKLQEDGEMVLSGLIVDQAALMGVLNKLHRLNLTILSFGKVNR